MKLIEWNTTNTKTEGSNINAFLPETYYILRAVMHTVKELQNNIDQTMAAGSFLSNPSMDLSHEMRRDTWCLLSDLFYKIKGHGDMLELTIQDELRRFLN